MPLATPSGLQPIYDEEKFTELVIYIADQCRDQSYFGATKMSKILFYCDFFAMRELGTPMTGAQYNAEKYGPFPSNFHLIRNRLVNRGDARVFSLGKQQRIVPKRKPDMSSFSPEEIEIVDRMISTLENLNAKQVSDLSHKFLGWRAANTEREGTPIPYATFFVDNREPTDSELEMILGKYRKDI